MPPGPAQSSTSSPLVRRQALRQPPRHLLPRRQTSSTITASQLSPREDLINPNQSPSSQDQDTPPTNRETQPGQTESSGSNADQPAPERIARTVRQRALSRFEQHMLEMSREEHEMKLELIRVQARRDEELHNQRRRTLRAKREAYDAKMRYY